MIGNGEGLLPLKIPVIMWDSGRVREHSDMGHLKELTQHFWSSEWKAERMRISNIVPLKGKSPRLNVTELTMSLLNKNTARWK